VAIAVVALWAYATFRLIRSRGDSVLWCVTGVLLTFTVLFTLVTTVGRVCLGPHAARTALSRRWTATRLLEFADTGTSGLYPLSWG
jgi:hypothetical protein